LYTALYLEFNIDMTCLMLFYMYIICFRSSAHLVLALCTSLHQCKTIIQNFCIYSFRQTQGTYNQVSLCVGTCSFGGHSCLALEHCVNNGWDSQTGGHPFQKDPVYW